MSFSACSLSSSLDSLKNLFSTHKNTQIHKRLNHIIRNKFKNNLHNEAYEGFVSVLLGKSLESNVVSVKVCKQRVVHIGNIVFHTAFTSLYIH